ncbi:SCO family protein [Arsenicibacter rosenii]|uniref:SCO family protein n=1 Tax=Arsenicibacter rosenii TaxID=1750698 RepID=A0A1S2VQN6_9BACT|nr:SCO family protein [Arsenicibacter rosenii]OIN61089.1 SCO family protein [Arsenicibacter rosenii]
MGKSLIALAGALLLLTGCGSDQKKTAPLPYYNTADFTPLWLEKGDVRIGQLHRLSEFSFTDQNNRRITEQTVSGKIHVAGFFFTSCPGLCPRLTRSMTEVQEAFRDNPQVVLLSYSVTPERDSVPVLRAYATKHQVIDQKWHLLTGDHDAIYQLARKSYFADENIGVQKGENDFLHTENLILIDGDLHIRGIYNGTLPLDVQQLIQDIKALNGGSDRDHN